MHGTRMSIRRARASLTGMGLAAVFCLFATAALTVSDTARADMRLCNKTSGQIGVSIGYRDPKGWVTEGWWNLPANFCEVIVGGPLVSRYYYIYAVDYEQGGEWGGQAFMCVKSKEFTIRGIRDCIARGFERTGFFEIDTGNQRNWTVQLTDPVGGGNGG